MTKLPDGTSFFNVVFLITSKNPAGALLFKGTIKTTRFLIEHLAIFRSHDSTFSYIQGRSCTCIGARFVFGAGCD